MRRLLLAVWLVAATACATTPIAPAVGSLVCGETGASYAPGWAQCKTPEQWRCVVARDRCAKAPTYEGCQDTGFASIELPLDILAGSCDRLLSSQPSALGYFAPHGEAP